MTEYLCDHCKWDYGHICKNPRRPNVKVEDGCDDFEHKHEDSLCTLNNGMPIKKKAKGE